MDAQGYLRTGCAAMNAEEKVRAAFELVHRCDGSYRGYPRNTVLIQVVHGHWLDFRSWSAAAAFTDARLAEIAEISEEISLLTGKILLNDADISVVARTLTRLQAIREELRRGMK